MAHLHRAGALPPPSLATPRIISWNRLLSGNLRDPLIGRDILIGSLAGAALLANTYGWHVLSSQFGAAPEMPLVMPLESLLGRRKVAAFFSLHLISSLVNPAVYMQSTARLSSNWATYSPRYDFKV
ncbi:MAG: hypothetical protein H0V18_07370 [Pyrinomonadaceae bacterium]|nr:hypothetical protein [Pyrinomonadaceae bacterium]